MLTNGADAAELVAGWQRRLIALAETPEHLFRDTPRHLIERHHRRLSTFAGYAEAEVADAEARLAVRFPEVFRAYLLEMAKSPGGRLLPDAAPRGRVDAAVPRAGDPRTVDPATGRRSVGS